MDLTRFVLVRSYCFFLLLINSIKSSCSVQLLFLFVFFFIFTQILPSTRNKCWNTKDSIALQMTETGLSSETPTSVYSMLERAALEYPNAKALTVKRDGQWKSYTYKRYFDQSCTAARAFIKLGLERMHGVCIMGFNSPEWFISNFGAIFAGGLSVGIYVNNSASACIHMAQDSKAQVIMLK